MMWEILVSLEEDVALHGQLLAKRRETSDGIVGAVAVITGYVIATSRIFHIRNTQKVYTYVYMYI